MFGFWDGGCVVPCFDGEYVFVWSGGDAAPGVVRASVYAEVYFLIVDAVCFMKKGGVSCCVIVLD